MVESGLCLDEWNARFQVPFVPSFCIGAVALAGGFRIHVVPLGDPQTTSGTLPFYCQYYPKDEGEILQTEVANWIRPSPASGVAAAWPSTALGSPRLSAGRAVRPADTSILACDPSKRKFKCNQRKEMRA